MAIRRMERAERGTSDVIMEVIRSRAKLRLENQKKNVEFNAGSEGKPMSCSSIL